MSRRTIRCNRDPTQLARIQPVHLTPFAAFDDDIVAYGPRFPVNPGQFFGPISATILLAALGTLIAGWNTPNNYRVWLTVSAGSILAVWVFTVVAFWPRNGTLFAAGSGSPMALTDRAELIRQARLWVRYDWCRIAMMLVGFISAVRAMSMQIRATPGSPPA